MMKYTACLIFMFYSVSAAAQDTLMLAKSDSKRQQDSIYFYNVLEDRGINHQLYISAKVKSLNYTGALIIGAIDFQYMIRSLLNIPSESTFSFALQLLLNNDTLRIDSQIIPFVKEARYKLISIPAVEENAAKGEDYFLVTYFTRAGKDWSFMKGREFLLNKSSERAWSEFQNAIIHHLIQWRYYCRYLHDGDGRLLCYKEFVPPLYPRKRK